MLLLGCWSNYTLISRAGRDLLQTQYDSDLNVHLLQLTQHDVLAHSNVLPDITSRILVRNDRRLQNILVFLFSKF